MSSALFSVPKRVLITAGASGIGLAMAQAFSAAAATVMVCDADEAALQRLRLDLPGIATCQADVSNEGDVERLFHELDRQLGGLDVLVNNAGIAGPTGPIESLQLAEWQRTLEVNLTGQFLCIRSAVPRLRLASRQHGDACIINLSSAAGHLGMPGRSPYSASKWAVVGLTKTLAIELGADGIRVNAILPGAVDGPRIQSVIAAKAESSGRSVDDVARAYVSQAALGRLATPQDIAHMAVFAASAWARHVSGQELVVDGFTQALS